MLCGQERFASVVLWFSILIVGQLTYAADGLVGFDFDRSSSALIVEYDVLHEMLPAEGVPRMRVFGDGRVEIHYPAYMKLAGTHTYYLDEPSLLSLMAELVSSGVADETGSAVQARIKLKDKSEATVTETADATEVRITLQIQRTTAASQRQRMVRSRLDISDRGLLKQRADTDPSLRSLDRAISRLELMTRDQRMEPQ